MSKSGTLWGLKSKPRGLCKILKRFWESFELWKKTCLFRVYSYRGLKIPMLNIEQSIIITPWNKDSLWKTTSISMESKRVGFLRGAIVANLRFSYVFLWNSLLKMLPLSSSWWWRVFPAFQGESKQSPRENPNSSAPEKWMRLEDDPRFLKKDLQMFRGKNGKMLPSLKL